MSSSAQKLLVLAEQFEKQAVDIRQPSTFEEDFKKYKEMLSPTPKDDEGAYEKWLKENSPEEEPDLPLLPPKPGGPKPEANGMHDEDLPPELFEDLDADTYMRAASDYEAKAYQLLAEAKEKKEKKLDPKAKVRNRGTVCVPASSAKDKKDHFPINSIDQARNALARVHQYSSVPEWYSGSLKGLQSLVSRKVHSKYPAIGKEKKSKKSSVLDMADQFYKFAQGANAWDQAVDKQISELYQFANAQQGTPYAARLTQLIGNLRSTNRDAVLSGMDQIVQFFQEHSDGANANRFAWAKNHLEEVDRSFGRPTLATPPSEVAQTGEPPTVDVESLPKVQTPSTSAGAQFDPWVQKLQQFLTDKGFNPSSNQDGKWGRITSGALKQWQQSMVGKSDITQATGQLDGTTLHELVQLIGARTAPSNAVASEIERNPNVIT